MTATQPERTQRALAPLTYSDIEGRTYRELSYERKDEPCRTSLEEVCLMCGGVGLWSSHYLDAVFVAAPGHRLEYIEGTSLVVIDSCGNHLVL